MIMGRRADINVNPKRNATNIEFMLNEMSLKPRLDLIILGRCDGSPFGYIFVLDNSWLWISPLLGSDWRVLNEMGWGVWLRLRLRRILDYATTVCVCATEIVLIISLSLSLSLSLGWRFTRKTCVFGCVWREEFLRSSHFCIVLTNQEQIIEWFLRINSRTKINLFDVLYYYCIT